MTNIKYRPIIWKATRHRWHYEIYSGISNGFRPIPSGVGKAWSKRGAERKSAKFIEYLKILDAGQVTRILQIQALKPPEERALQEARILYENDEDREYVIDHGAEVGVRFKIPLEVKVIRVIDEDRSIARHFNRLEE